MKMFLDFPKAASGPRGCGERKPGGIYAECGLSPYGRSIEHFLIDPPQPLPNGLDLINKPQSWMRCNPASGEPMLHPETEQPIYDLLIWVGAQHYPEVPDYVEEVRLMGASRRLNPQMDLTKLTRFSQMILAHPKTIIVNWRDLEPPHACKKGLPYHSRSFYDKEFFGAMHGKAVFSPEEKAVVSKRYKKEQGYDLCISKLWEVLPREEAEDTFEREDGQILSLRRIGSTIYDYTSTGEVVQEWHPGLFLALPLTSIALIQYNNGSVDEKAKLKLLAGIERNKEMALPFYETDR